MVTQSGSSEPNLKPIWLVLLLVLLIGAGFWAWNAWPTPTDPPPRSLSEPAPVPGHPAPDFSLTSLAGETIQLSDFRGQPVLLNFWATWCTECRLEMPQIQAAYEQFGDELVILGINSRDRGDVVGFLAEYEITYPILLDTADQAYQAYQVRGMPVSFFITPDGTVDGLFRGQLTSGYIESRLERLQNNGN